MKRVLVLVVLIMMTILFPRSVKINEENEENDFPVQEGEMVYYFSGDGDGKFLGYIIIYPEEEEESPEDIYDPEIRWIKV